KYTAMNNKDDYKPVANRSKKRTASKFSLIQSVFSYRRLVLSQPRSFVFNWKRLILRSSFILRKSVVVSCVPDESAPYKFLLVVQCTVARVVFPLALHAKTCNR